MPVCHSVRNQPLIWQETVPLEHKVAREVYEKSCEVQVGGGGGVYEKRDANFCFSLLFFLITRRPLVGSSNNEVLTGAPISSFQSLPVPANRPSDQCV